MAFDRTKIGLFWSLPPSADDWANLLNSHVTRVQLPLAFCDHNTCRVLGQHGISLTVRVDNEALRNPYHVGQMIQLIQRHVTVDAAILGNEWDNQYNLNYGSPEWGVPYTFDVYQMLYTAHRTLEGLVPLVSPPLTMRSISEDDPPAPGRASWYSVLRGVFNHFSYNGCHLYCHSWRSEVDVHRVKWALKGAQEQMHRPLYIDELGVNSGSQVERMAAYIDITRMLETHPLGERVAFLSFFLSNGTPDGHWDAGYLIKDPAAYAMLGEFMGSN